MLQVFRHLSADHLIEAARASLLHVELLHHHTHYIFLFTFLLGLFGREFFQVRLTAILQLDKAVDHLHFVSMFLNDWLEDNLSEDLLLTFIRVLILKHLLLNRLLSLLQFKDIVWPHDLSQLVVLFWNSFLRLEKPFTRDVSKCCCWF